MGLVHRLDRPTGGVMVFAKSSKAAARLSEQMKTGDFEKRYYTVLAGIPREEKATLVHYMKKNAVNNMVYVCAPTTEGAKRAELDYAVLEKNGDISLAEVRLHTGRSHQIRVQMNAIGTPVYGDMRYGGEKAKKAFSRFGRIISPSRIPSPRSGWYSTCSRPKTSFPGRNSISTR